MFQKIALAATAAAFLAVAAPVEAAPGPGPGGPGPGHGGPPPTMHYQPAPPHHAKKKHVFYVKKKVCGPVFKWRTVWWNGHPHKAKIKVGYRCHWRWVPVWRWN